MFETVSLGIMESRKDDMVASASRKNGSFKSTSAERPRRRGLNSPVCLHFLYQYFFLYLKRKLRKREENEFAFAREDQTRQRRGDPKKKRASLSPTSVLFPHQATQKASRRHHHYRARFLFGVFLLHLFFFFFGRGGGARSPGRRASPRDARAASTKQRTSSRLGHRERRQERSRECHE